MSDSNDSCSSSSSAPSSSSKHNSKKQKQVSEKQKKKVMKESSSSDSSSDSTSSSSSDSKDDKTLNHVKSLKRGGSTEQSKELSPKRLKPTIDPKDSNLVEENQVKITENFNQSRDSQKKIEQKDTSLKITKTSKKNYDKSPEQQIRSKTIFPDNIVPSVQTEADNSNQMNPAIKIDLPKFSKENVEINQMAKDKHPEQSTKENIMKKQRSRSPFRRHIKDRRIKSSRHSRNNSSRRRTKSKERRIYSGKQRSISIDRIRSRDRRSRDRRRSIENNYSSYYCEDRRAYSSKELNNKVVNSEKSKTTVKSSEPPHPDTEISGRNAITARQRKTVDLLTSRTGGAYIPPAKLRMLQNEITDKSSAAYQRIAWEALKKSIHGYINKVNVDNIGIITRELLKENIIRGRGLLCRSIIQAQAASPTFTHVYGALLSIINSKFPNIGELLLRRLVIQFKRGFRRNDKTVCLSSTTFIAHLVNQRVAHEILALEILTLLVENPTDDSIEVAIAFLKECGMKLTEVSVKGINAIFEMLKNILHEGKLDKRVQYMIEVVFQVRKDGFKDHQSVLEALELVEEDDQFTHLIMLDEATDSQDVLNVFKFDDKYQENEIKYKTLSKELLGSEIDDSDEFGNSSTSGSDSENSDNDDVEKTKNQIIDQTETNLVALRRTIYLTIHSSLDYEECAHKLMKMQLKPGQEMELCHMFLDCCAEQRTYEKFYGLLAQRFCTINKTYVEPFEQIFKDTYTTTHRLDTNRLRNVSKFFAHLLFTNAIGWDVFEYIRLNEDDTTSSSRIFIKILFQELAEYMGLGKLNERLKDVTFAESFSGLFPRDNPKNTRFSINFFTSIGLGGLTDELREFLKSVPKNVPALNTEILNVPDQTFSDSSDSSSSNSSSDSSSTSSSSTSTDSASKQNKRKLKRSNKTNKNDSTSSSNSTEDSSSESSESDNSGQKKKKIKKKRKKGKVSTDSSGESGKKKSKRWFKSKNKRQKVNKSSSDSSTSSPSSSSGSYKVGKIVQKKTSKNSKNTKRTENINESIEKGYSKSRQQSRRDRSDSRTIANTSRYDHYDSSRHDDRKKDRRDHKKDDRSESTTRTRQISNGKG